MKKIILTTAVIFLTSGASYLNAQLFNKDKLKIGKEKEVSKEKEVVKEGSGSKDSPAEVAINGVKFNIKKLDELLKSPKWTDLDYRNKVLTYINEMEDKIASIKRDDPKYDVKDFEKKHAEYKEAYKKGKAENASAMGKGDEYRMYNRKIERIMKMVDGIAYADSYSDMISNTIRNSTLAKLKDSLSALDYQSMKNKFTKEELKALDFNDLNNETVLNVFTFEKKFKTSIVYAITNQYEKRAAKVTDDIGEHFIIVDQGLSFLNVVLPHLTKENTTELNAKKAEFEASVKKDKEYLKSNVSTGTYHDSHYNQLIFTNDGMKIGAENPSLEKAEFNAKDNIYMNIYLNGKYNTSIETEWQHAEVYVKLNIDGKDIELGLPIDLTPADVNKSAYCFPLLPSPENNTQPHVAYWASKTFKDLSVGKHTIIAFASFKGKTVANKFTLNIDDKEAMKNRYEVFETKRGDLFKIPGKVGTFAPAEIVADVKRIVQEDSEGGKLTVVKVISFNSDWSIEKNKYTGVILKRFLEFGLIVKDANGKCWYQGEQFYQDFAGSGKYTKTTRGATFFIRERINCAATK
ncbi:MAG: hypothetical protein JNJ41_13460 [Bacteroidia bacterium]|nr:hypothetical protein [Bacteroidia bacterium]